MHIKTVNDITNLDNIQSFTSEHASVISYLLEYYPDGFEGPVSIFLGDEELDVDDYDRTVGINETIVIIFHPGFTAIFGSVVLAYIANFVIAAAISYAIGEIFKQDIPSSARDLRSSVKSNGQSSSVYNLNSQQNIQRLGQPIPVIYGKIRVYPSIVENSYKKYIANEEYVYQLMCIGLGEYNIDHILVSDTKYGDLNIGILEVVKLVESDFGDIQSAVGDAEYHQRVREVPEISNLELKAVPTSLEYIMRFEGNTIEFVPYGNGDVPDLSALQSGSTIEVTGSINNNTIYTVANVTDNIVTIDGNVLATEPTLVETVISNGGNFYETEAIAPEDYKRFIKKGTISGNMYWTAITSQENARFVLSGFGANDGKPYDIRFNLSGGGDVHPMTEGTYVAGSDVIAEINDTQFDMVFTHMLYTAKFATSYGPFTLNTENSGNCDSIEFDFLFPRGLYATGTNGKLEEYTVELEVVIETYLNDVFQSSATTIGSGTSLEFSPLRVTGNANVNKMDGAIYKARLRRITPETDDTGTSDMLWVRAIKYIEVTPDCSDFGNITLLWVRAKASNGLSAVSQFQINAWVTRRGVPNTISDAIKDIYINSDYGAGLPESDLDLPVMAPGVDAEFNGALDTNITVMDAMKLIGRAGRYVTYLDGQKVKLRKDEAQPIRVSLFNETNIIKGSLKIDYLFGQHDGFDGIAIKYRDPADFKEAVSIYPDTSTRPESMELIGCTDHAVADEAAKYGWQQKESRKKIVTFSTDDQGLIPNYLDRIAVTHNTAQWGLGGQIFSVDGDTIGVSYRFDEDEVVDYNTIIFRNADGSVSDTYAFNANSPNEIVLQTAAPAWLYVGDEYDNTFFSFGYTESFIKDYIVTSVKPKGNNAVEISAVNYDETVYDV